MPAERVPPRAGRLRAVRHPPAGAGRASTWSATASGGARQYIREFLRRVGGFERCRTYTHQGETKLTEVVVRRMAAAEPVFAEDARFLAGHTDRVTKFALPSPFLIAVRYWHEDHSRDAYPTLAALPRPPGRDPGPRGAGPGRGGHRHRADRRPGPDLLLRPTADGRARRHDERLRRDWDVGPAVPAGPGGDQPRWPRGCGPRSTCTAATASTSAAAT